MSDKMRKFVFVTLFLLVCYIANAQTFQATVSSNPVSVGEKFQISFTLNGDGNNFKAPSFKGFQVLSGPGQSSSMVYSNGKTTRSYTLTYILAATAEGTFTISPASVSSNGKTIQSNSIVMKVLPESAAQKQQKQQAQKQDQSLSQDAKKIIAKNLFIRLSVNKSTVYQGESVRAQYKLYRNPELNLVSLTPKKSPSFNGFWTQEFDQKNYNWQWEVVNGMRFQTAVVKEVILIPQQSGKLTIDPFEWTCVARLQVQNQNRDRRSHSLFDDFFDDPFFGGGRGFKDFENQISSGSSSITVKPLPANKPQSFTGGVGNLKMEAWVDNKKGLTNEPITLKVKISGNGNLKIIDQPVIKFPADFEQYDPKVNDNTTVTSSGISGNITYEYLAIPRNQGKYQLGPVEFTYFDLNSKSYKTIKSDVFDLVIGKGSGGQTSFAGSATKEDIQLLDHDIKFLKTDIKLVQNGGSFYSSAFYMVFLILPFILFFLILLWRRKNKENLKNRALINKRKAGETAKRRLSKAKAHLVTADKTAFYNEVAAALWGYTADKLMIQKSNLSKERVKELLEKNGLTAELCDRVIKTIDDCEYARYAPSNDEEKNMHDTYKEAEDVIIAVESACHIKRVQG
jgi:hypothetical protein